MGAVSLRLFNLDVHVSVITDVRDIFAELGHEVTSWSISNHNWVFGRKPDPVEIITQATWRGLDRDMCAAFRERYRGELERYDGFVVTHTPCLYLVFRDFGKPIIVVNSTRYEQPFTLDPERWSWLDAALRDGSSRGTLHVVSNNKADRCYLNRQAGIDSEWIPSLCRYTNSKYRPSHQKFLFVSRTAKALSLPSSVHRQVVEPARTFRTWSGRPRGHAWQELYSFRGIVHLPYQVSAMSIFEQYTANVPLFFPTKELLLELHRAHPKAVLSELSNYQVLGREYHGTGLNRTEDPDVIRQWIDLADYYDPEEMPEIQYFESFDHLAHLLETTDLEAVSERMRSHNAVRQHEAVGRWGRVLERLAASKKGMRWP